MNQATRPASHWIVRMNYRNRAVCFALLFATVGAHMAGRGYGAAAWGLLVLQFLAYPHLLYWRAQRARDPRRAELNNMVIDVLLFGVWAAALAFPLWISFILFVAGIVNLTAFRGPKGFALAVAFMAAGALATVAVTGPRVAPGTDWLTTGLAVLSVSFFLLLVANGVHARASQLHEARERLRASEQALQSANAALQQQLDEIHSLQAQLRDQADRDPLTGLYNRRYLGATLERELARCRREGQPLSLMLIDIDHFKRINDTYGHQAGDEVLRCVAAMLGGEARASDVVCRYGGEEFLLLLPGMPQAIALERAEAHRAALESLAIAFGEFHLRATLSVGIAAYPGDGTTPEELIGCADQALYRAKAAGRNRVAAFAPAPAAATPARS